MPWYGWHSWWHMGWMWLFWILGIVVLILIIRAFSGQSSQANPRGSAEEILRKRYARGAIDKHEYEQRLTDLRR